MSARLTAFPPIESPASHTLILGSMPSVRSLELSQYYAHPQNRFWPLMFEVFGRAPSDEYGARRSLLLEHGIALWDVLKACEREGSLDASIRAAEVNDFDGFFIAHPALTRVLLNGTHAATVFRRHARAKEGLTVISLPSTSPANRTLSEFSLKQAWKEALIG